MSEGGVYPWKRADNKRAVTAPDYKRLLRPLPAPPAGLSWIYDEAAPKKWVLVAHTNVDAVQEEIAPSYHAELSNQYSNVDDEWTSATAATATRVVPLETEALLPSPTTQPAFAQATLTASTSTSSSLETNNNNKSQDDDEDNQQDGIVLLPQARMVATAATAGTAPASFKSSPNDSLSNHSKNQDDSLAIEYTEHVIMPTDTLAGLCLRYKISRRDLQRANRFYGNDLRLAPGKLYIPITERARQLGWKPQDVTSPEFKTAAFMAQMPALSIMEAKCYLETNDWDLEAALREAREDAAWERQEEQRQQEQAAAARAKQQEANTQADPYAEEKDKDDLDCLACLSFLVSALRSLTARA